jgi:uncharacterized membrane protein YgdD (TMEM256/DUF423 family)
VSQVNAARIFALLGAVNAFVAVGAGAFGAHGLKKRLTAEMLGIFEVGVRYHFYHALGLFAVAWLASQRAPAQGAAGWLMVAGIAIFSGSLYVLALTGTRWLGAITPLGGLCFLAAWACVAYGAWRWAH